MAAHLSLRLAGLDQEAAKEAEGVKPGGPALVAERRIGYNVVEGLERVAIEIKRVGECVALLYVSCGVVVQHHIHSCEPRGGVIFFLPEVRHLHVLVVTCFFANFQQQRARPASRVVDRSVVGRICAADAEYLGYGPD